MIADQIKLTIKINHCRFTEKRVLKVCIGTMKGRQKGEEKRKSKKEMTFVRKQILDSVEIRAAELRPPHPAAHMASLAYAPK